jgi:hypothetical protein
MITSWAEWIGEKKKKKGREELSGKRVHTFARAQSLQGRLVAQCILAALHNKGEASVDALLRLFLCDR